MSHLVHVETSKEQVVDGYWPLFKPGCISLHGRLSRQVCMTRIVWDK
jgi:hypothetical protein